MRYCSTPVYTDTSAALQVCDVSAGSVRLARQLPRPGDTLSEADRQLLQLRREEAIHALFRRLFLRTSEQYLKGQLDEKGQLRG